jgi:hypothetical protein
MMLPLFLLFLILRREDARHEGKERVTLCSSCTRGKLPRMPGKKLLEKTTDSSGRL